MKLSQNNILRKVYLSFRQYFNRDHIYKRIFMSLLGVTLCAFSVGGFKCSLFGVDPFQCFSMGLHGALFAGFLDYGSFYAILCLVLLLVDVFLDKHYIGLATLFNLVLTGYIADFSAYLINLLLPDPGIVLRVIMLLFSIVLMCFVSAFYMTADLGVSVYDAIPIVISNKTGWSFRILRILCDATCVLIGLISGLMPGIGTLITAFFMGPLIDLFNRKCARPFLYGKEEAEKMNRPA